MNAVVVTTLLLCFTTVATLNANFVEPLRHVYVEDETLQLNMDEPLSWTLCNVASTKVNITAQLIGIGSLDSIQYKECKTLPGFNMSSSNLPILITDTQTGLVYTSGVVTRFRSQNTSNVGFFYWSVMGDYGLTSPMGAGPVPRRQTRLIFVNLAADPSLSTSWYLKKDRTGWIHFGNGTYGHKQGLMVTTKLDPGTISVQVREEDINNILHQTTLFSSNNKWLRQHQVTIALIGQPGDYDIFTYPDVTYTSTASWLMSVLWKMVA